MISGELLEKWINDNAGTHYLPKFELLDAIQSGSLSPPAPAPDGVHTETNCPTCGSAVKVGGDGETHYYIPITAPREVVADPEGVGALEHAVLVMLNELHANVPADQRPVGMMDLSDDQAKRAKAAINAVIEVLSAR
jgi:hypothetical protein